MASDDPDSGFSISDENSETKSGQTNQPRRGFLRGIIAGIIVAVLGYLSWTKFFFPPGSPQLNGDKLAPGTAGHVPLGTLSQFSASAVPVQVAYQGRVAFVDVKGGAPKVLSGVCTHAGCSVTWQSKSSQYLCPCHGSIFSRDGAVLHGPASVPLPSILSSVDGDTVYADG